MFLRVFNIINRIKPKKKQGSKELKSLGKYAIIIILCMSHMTFKAVNPL